MATVTAPWWLWWVLGFLVAAGVVAVCWVAAGWAERAADWLRRDRVTPLLGPDEESEQELAGLCAGCWDDSEHCDGAIDTCNCTCTWPEDWAERPLPPERTWEQMTSHQLPLADPEQEKVSPRRDRRLPAAGMSPAERRDWQRREGVRRRQARRCEMGYRAHYAAMGFDFPSGLMERVRELAP